MGIANTAEIHKLSVIEDGAIIHDGVKIGPFCTVGKDVELHAGVELVSHVSVTGYTSIGSGTKIYPHASIGSAPQDLKYKGEPSRLEIGENNSIREYVTMNPGTESGGMLTKVGSGSLFMMGVHVGHDCLIGDGVVIANYVCLAGHVEVGNRVVIGGLAGIHQFVRIGDGAMVGGLAGVVADVIPAGIVMGERAHLEGLNLVGLKRSGIDRDYINGLREAFKTLFMSDGNVKDHVDEVSAKFKGNPLVEQVIEFVTSDSSRSLHTPKK